jgi:N-glycosyltransferase
MRLLFTTMPAGGHLRALVPLAHAARRAGHDVAVCTPATAAAQVEGYGLTHLPAGEDWVARDLAAADRTGQPPADHADRLRRYLITDGYPGSAALRMARDVLQIAHRWRPDAIVRENAEFGGYLAAEVLELPHVSIGAAGAHRRYLDVATLAPALDRGRAALGLAPDPRGRRIHAYLHANLVPPAYDPDELATPNTRCYRSAAPEPPGERLPGWLAEFADAPVPLVLAAFGTMHPTTSGWDAVTAAVIEALAAVPCRAVVATGSGMGSRYVHAVPPHIRLVASLAQPLALETSDLFIHHGGFNSVREALRCAVPAVVLPWLTDSVDNAQRCARLGIAEVVLRAEATPARLAEACMRVLGDSAYRRSARALQRDLLALPPLSQLVEDIVALSAG